MAAAPRVVAELGRPETPDETAARKAASSAAYRSSKTFRNLLVALGVILAIVAVIVAIVPRGSLPEAEPADVVAAAASASEAVEQPLLVPEVPADWRANSARLEGTSMWRVVYAPPEGFVRVAQGIGVGSTWVAETLGGLAPTGSVTIDGIAWDEYTIPSTAQSAGISYAVATDAGSDTVLIYGSTDADTAAIAAAGVADQIRDLREETP